MTEEEDSMAEISGVVTMTELRNQIPPLGSAKSYQNPQPVIAGNEQMVAFFGPGVECVGEIWYEGNVQIDGELEGLVHTNGTLMIGDRSVIKAKIEAGTVICRGSIQGDVVAKEIVRLLAPGSIDGTLSTPQLSVETGGVINGRISMDFPK
jgi:cytoskeletal protein CcmA (bactofilin family)